ncbi:Protein of unknown function DUF111 [Fragilaria crotonensis]|nr:Protein of unknown function DUF111 [Fragilaria crotonensis]
MTALGKAITCDDATIGGVVSDRALCLVLDISIQSGRLGLLPGVIASLQEAELVVTDYAAAFQLEWQSLFEIVCILLLLEYFNIDTFSCSALPMGEGHVEKDGGYIPVPSPSTLNLMLGMRTSSGPRGITGELVSSCACALLREMTMSGDMQRSVPPVFIPERVGLGTNANGSQTLRLILGRNDSEPKVIHNLLETRDVPWNTDSLTLLEANLDDTTAEALAFAMEVLLSNGALDAWVTPIVMKKGRAAHTLHCLCSDSDIHKSQELLVLIFRHTTTLGVRINRDVERAALRRSFASVQTPYLEQERQGMVDVKIGYLGDEVVSVKPEFDHCRAISVATDVPIQRIVDAAIREWTKTQDVEQFTDA